jgi:hypothetical protein
VVILVDELPLFSARTLTCYNANPPPRQLTPCRTPSLLRLSCSFGQLGVCERKPPCRDAPSLSLSLIDRSFRRPCRRGAVCWWIISSCDILRAPLDGCLHRDRGASLSALSAGCGDHPPAGALKSLFSRRIRSDFEIHTLLATILLSLIPCRVGLAGSSYCIASATLLFSARLWSLLDLP